MSPNRVQPLILIVDTEPHVRRLAEVTLARGGYRVSIACDSMDALEKIQVERPDLVLLDVLMPSPDHVEILRRLKSEPVICAVPVLYLVWPFNTADLLTRIHQALSPPRA